MGDQASIITVEKESVTLVATEKSDSRVVEKTEYESGNSLDKNKELETPILTEKINQQDDTKLDRTSIIFVETDSLISVATEKSDFRIIENTESANSIVFKKGLETVNATEKIVQQDDTKYDMKKEFEPHYLTEKIAQQADAKLNKESVITM